MGLTVTLTLKSANQSLWMTIWLMAMHYHTKFGSKNLSDSEDIWTNIHQHFKMLLWPWTNNPISPYPTIQFLAYDNVLSTQVWWQKDQQFRRYSKKCHVLIIWALALTLTLKIANNFFLLKIWLIMLHYHTKFGNKMCCSSEDIWTNID